MMRFFCTSCAKVKRVRVMPPGIDLSSDVPSERVGECRRHTSRLSKAVVFDRVKRYHPKRAKAHASAPQPKTRPAKKAKNQRGNHYGAGEK